MQKDKIKKIVNMSMKVFSAIEKKHGKKVPLEFIEGEMSCPVCKKLKMGYTVSNYNGHRHAWCKCFGYICE